MVQIYTYHCLLMFSKANVGRVEKLVCNCINYKLEVLHFAMVAGPES